MTTPLLPHQQRVPCQESRSCLLGMMVPTGRFEGP